MCWFGESIQDYLYAFVKLESSGAIAKGEAMPMAAPARAPVMK